MALPVASVVAVDVAQACQPLSDDGYTAALALRMLPHYTMAIDGVVIEPMRNTMLGFTPATVRVTKVWKGPKVRSLQIHHVSLCDTDLLERGERLQVALLRTDEAGMTGLPLSLRIKLLFTGEPKDFAERWRLLFTRRHVLVLNSRANGNRPYDREMRRLLAVNAGRT